MYRRQFMTALAATVTLPVIPAIVKAQSAGRIKITDIRVIPLKVLREVGSVDPSGIVEGFPPRMSVSVGGGSIIEIHTDEGFVGLGPGIAEGTATRINSMLNGLDPLDINEHARVLSRLGRDGASVEIGLWDLIGKITNQPLYKLWGGGEGRVTPYSSCQIQSTIEERVDLAVQVQAQGWKGIKLRTSFPTFEEDVRIVADIRAACGDDFDILTDANKGGLPGRPVTPWSFQRAVDTARAYEEMGVYWLEEPLDRFDYKKLSELNQKVDMPIAGAENNVGLHEFRTMIEQGCFDILNPEVMLMGPTALRQIAALASAFGVQTVPHLGDRRLGTICAMHIVASLPDASYCELINDPPVMDFAHGFAIAENPPILESNGTMKLPEGPGLGVTINPEML